MSQIFRARDEICKLYINLAANILKKSVLMNGKIKFLEPFRILTMNFDDPDDMKIYLLSPSEQYDHFIKVYGNVIMLKDLSNKESTKICEVFQNFIKVALIHLKQLLPFDDIVIQKIAAFDPDCGTSHTELLELGEHFTNIISPENYHEFYEEVFSWKLDIDNNKLKEIKKNYIDAEKDFDAINFYKDKAIERSFPLITKLGRALLSLPHSSASIERAFSQLKLIKNERRTNLSNECLESLLIAKINNIDLQDSNVVNSLYDYFKTNQSQKKRKYSQITASPPKNQIESSQINLIHSQNIEIEVNSDNESISTKFKKVKLNEISPPQDLISIEHYSEEAHLTTISKYKYIFVFKVNPRGRRRIKESDRFLL